MLKKVIVSLSVLSLAFTSPVFSAPADKEYKNTAESYSIKYPSDWTQEVQNNGWVITMFKSQPENPQDTFIENTNVIVEKAQGYTLAQYYKANLDTMKGPSALKEFKIVQAGDTKINNNPAKVITYTHTYEKIKLKVKAYFLCNGKNGYVITSTASPDSFKAYEPEFDRISKSFKFIK